MSASVASVSGQVGGDVGERGGAVVVHLDRPQDLVGFLGGVVEQSHQGQFRQIPSRIPVTVVSKIVDGEGEEVVDGVFVFPCHTRCMCLGGDVPPHAHVLSQKNAACHTRCMCLILLWFWA